MASKQTRRSISVRGTTYSLLRDFCAEHERSMSDVVEELLGKILENGEPARKTVAPLIARAATPVRVAPMKAAPAPAKPAHVEHEDRAAVRVVPLPKPAPAPVAAVPREPMPARPAATAPARPVPVANAGRPAPTPAAKVQGTERTGSDYRAIRF